MGNKHLIVKRHGHLEEYDSRKVYGSVYASALNAHMGELESEKLADEVARAVDAQVSGLESVDSQRIRDLIVEELGGPENDVAYLYLHHLDIN